MSTTKANPTSGRCFTVGTTRVVTVSFLEQLEGGELLTGTPTVVDLAAVLTLASKGLNTVALVVESDKGADNIVASQAVQFSVTGGVAGTTYNIQVTVSTDGTIAQTLIANIELDAIAVTT